MRTSLSALTTGLFMATLLTACGGGGGDDNGSNNITPVIPIAPATPTNPLSSIQGDNTGVVGQSMGLAFLAGQDTPNYDSLQWTQTAGTNVTITAAKQEVISFIPSEASTYSFELVLSKNGQPIKTLTKSVTVNPATTQTASLRSDRVVGSGGTTTLRFYTPTPLTANQWEFSQVSGASAKIMLDSTETLAEVVVPKVTNDQVLTFKASSKLDPALTDTVTILVKANTSQAASDYFCASPNAGANCLPLNALTTHHPYVANSKYAAVLTDCVMSNRLNDQSICTLNTLPFIGIQSKDPTVEDIMSRVVVSHDWMGKNFENFLRNYDTNNDFKRLLRSTTAIVISENVRPSFYWGNTGTIYIEPDYLWMTPEQRDDIVETFDYRTSYSSGLNYLEFFDYEKDGKSVVYGDDYIPDINLRQSRTLDTIAMPLASLLYHELSHANDYMPIQAINSLSAGQLMQTPSEVMSNIQVSTRLSLQYPLTDERLKGLAQVEFSGARPTATQASYSSAQVADWFFAEKGTDMYNFYDPAEDLAMLFEESMMLSRFGVNRYFMFMTPRTSTSPYLVVRGEKNWVAAPTIKPRALFVVSNILPEALPTFQQKLATTSPTSLCAGTTLFTYFNTLCDNIQRLPYANAYFGRHSYQLPKAPTRGVAPIIFNHQSQ